MLSSTMKKLTCGVSAACLLAYSPTVQAAGQTIHIGVAANFANSVNDIISAFQSAYNYNTTSITATSDSTTNLQNCILTATSCPNTYQYDLFLAANTAAPAALAPTHAMVYSSVTQTPFFYAQGSLVFASNNTNVNNCPTTCGLPTTPTNFVIADPSKAPYGLAALQVLTQVGYSTVTTLGPFNPPLYTSPNIGTTWKAVDSSAPTYAYGFIAKSQVCQNGVLSSSHITSVFEYAYSGASVPGTQFGHTATTPSYGEIIQDGLAIELGQTNATKAEILQFINYLTTNVTSPGYTHNNGQGYAIIQRYCYGLTP